MTGSLCWPVSIWDLYCPCLLSLCVVGMHSRPVRTLPGPGFGSTHVRLPVVPHTLHSQVPSLHGLSHHRPSAVWGNISFLPAFFSDIILCFLCLVYLLIHSLGLLPCVIHFILISINHLLSFWNHINFSWSNVTDKPTDITKKKIIIITNQHRINQI